MHERWNSVSKPSTTLVIFTRQKEDFTSSFFRIKSQPTLIHHHGELMKTFTKIAFIAICLITTSLSFAQDNYTEGLVREVNFYKTKQGQFDEYMKYLRANFLPQQEEAKKQGLIVGYQVLLSTPTSGDDWDIAIVFLHKSYGAALDYSQSDADKMKAIAAKHYKTMDEQKQSEMASKRFDMREYKGTRYLREVTLKPM